MVLAKKNKCSEVTKIGPTHNLTPLETEKFRSGLLHWYDEKQRNLPWRTIARTEEDLNKRAYAVWVSEVMLQQTQVATVIDYFNKWMKKWPTVEDLSKATLEEVHEVWSGLGYYSRGRRLHEGALKVMNDLAGEIPRSAEALLKQLPGVGRYTAGAIASIAFGENTGVVDGNVCRVFSRICVIGADITSPPTMEALWSLANNSVDPERPGDFNQALMELGATVCTPKAPQCTVCPVQSMCKAFAQVELEKQKSRSKLVKSSSTNNNDVSSVVDIECAEEGCKLCFSSEDQWESSDGVLNYPRKGKKKPPREERTGVCVLQRIRKGCRDTEYLMVQRPETGLLASLWEFPSVPVPLESTNTESKNKMDDFLLESFCLNSGDLNKRQYITEVVHIFSHIHQTYAVEKATLKDDIELDLCNFSQPIRWVTTAELEETAVSTAMKKVFKVVVSTKSNKIATKSGLSSKGKKTDSKKQLGLDAFFKKS